MGRKKTNFDESLRRNQSTYGQYLMRLVDLSVSMFEWKNLPATVDPRYIEMSELYGGCAVYFRDEVLGDLCLSLIGGGPFDAYGNPTMRRAYSRYSNYQRELDSENSVIIWNNFTRTSCYPDLVSFASRLYNLDRIIDVNANAQKTPVLIQGTEKQRLSLLNLYKEFDGNTPVIFGDSSLNTQGVSSISTGAPYVSDKIYELKTQIWNEALTYLGISNVSFQKKERLISDEVSRSMGGTMASRYSRLESRREAVKKINRMFGTNIEVEYRETVKDLVYELSRSEGDE